MKTIYDPEELVYSIKHSDIPKGITQCKKHAWKYRKENEIECTKCPTVHIINPKDMKKYVR